MNGELPLALGQTDGRVAGGFNAPNRVVLTRDARPGQTFPIAVFGINGPISASPRNYIWMRSATLDLYAAGRVPEARPARGRRPASAGLERRSSRTPRSSRWRAASSSPRGRCGRADGALLFSSPNTNVIYRWHPEGRVEVFRTKSGYRGTDIGRYHQPGSNGLRSTPGPADDLPARQPPRHPRRAARQRHRARRRDGCGSTARTISSTAPTASCTSPTRRSGCPPAFAPREDRSAVSTASPTPTSRSRATELDGPERHRVLARRAVPHVQLAGRPQGRDALRRGAGWCARPGRAFST